MPSLTPSQYHSSCSRVDSVEAGDFALQIPVEAGAADEHIGFEEFGLIGDAFGGLSAGDGAGEEDLRGSIEGVQIAPGVKGLAPGGGFDVRHAGFIPHGGERVPRGFGADRFHAVSVTKGPAARNEKRCLALPRPRSAKGHRPARNFFDENAGPHKRRGPLEITSCGGGFSPACGAFCALLPPTST